MTNFIDMFCEMLPVNSEIQKTDNEFRKVLDKTVGEYMDAQEDIFDELFLESATGGWLDAHGKDYGIIRKLNESDDDYRQRIIFEKLEYLTVHNLQKIYGLELFAYITDYDASDNQLTSNNSYISNRYMAFASTELQNILNNKFVIGDSIQWL